MNNKNFKTNENKNKESNSNEEVMVKNEVTIGTEVKKVAFVDGNRAINKNNVKKHVESLKEFGRNLVPLLYVDAADVDGYNLYDAMSNQQIGSEDYDHYIVILDGQHRYLAAIQLVESEDNEGFTLDDLRWQKVDLCGKSIQNILIEVNTRTQPWKGSDYIGGCFLNAPDNEVAQFAKSLTDQGISSKTVNKYIFLNGRFSWSAAMKDTTELDKADINRAKSIWKVVETFPDKIKKRSVIIDYIIEAGGRNHWKEELKRIKSISDKDKNSLSDERVKDLSEAFKRIIDAV